MDLGGFIPVGLAGHHGLGFLGVTVGVVHHADLKHFGQGAAHGAVQGFVGQHQLVGGKAFRHGVGLVVAVVGALLAAAGLE